MTDPLSGKTTLTYDIRNRVIKVIYADPDGAGSQSSPEVEYGYNGTGQVTKFTDALDHVTTYTYHADLGYLTKVTRPDPDGAGSQTSPAIQYAYDDAGNLKSVTDPLGQVTTITYDKLYRVTRVTLPDPDGGGSQASPEFEYAWDAANQLTAVTDPLDRVTTRTYDNVGRLTKVTLPDPDGAGSAMSPEYQYAFDAAGRLVTITDPAGEKVDYAYDNLGRMTRSELPDPDGTGSLGRPTTLFAYDAAGNLTKLTDPEDNETTWTFDGLGRLTAETNELAKTRSYEYNALGNITKYTDRNGRVIELVYDNLSRLTEQKWKDGQTTVNTLSFAYNAAGWLTAADDDHSDYDYTLDNLGRVTQIDVNNGTHNDVRLKAVYNAAGGRTELAAEIDAGSGYTKDLKNTYTYDHLQRLTRVEQTDQSGGHAVADKRLDFTYNAAGQFTKITRYDDLSGTNEVAVTDFGYDGLGRLTDLAHKHDTTTIADYDWSYNANSWITQLDFTSSTGNNGISDYTYDKTGQLTAADHDYQADESYSYSENGNRSMTGYTTGANNRLTSDGTFDYTYDDEGNRITRTRVSSAQADDYKTEYAWDHHNRLVEIKYKNNSGTVTKEIDYVYDVFGRRIKKTIDADGAGSGAAVDTEYLYDGGHILLAFDDDGDLTNRYLHGPVVDMILADEEVTTTSSDGDIHWPLTDNLGSVRDIVDSAGVVENHLTYDAYGKITSETAPAVDHLFAYTGRERDEESDLQFNRARFYDPLVGRWASEDPIGFFGGASNVSVYVSNTPAMANDPSGLVEMWYRPGLGNSAGFAGPAPLMPMPGLPMAATDPPNPGGAAPYDGPEVPFSQAMAEEHIRPETMLPEPELPDFPEMDDWLTLFSHIIALLSYHKISIVQVESEDGRFGFPEHESYDEAYDDARAGLDEIFPAEDRRPPGMIGGPHPMFELLVPIRRPAASRPSVPGTSFGFGPGGGAHHGIPRPLQELLESQKRLRDNLEQLKKAQSSIMTEPHLPGAESRVGHAEYVRSRLAAIDDAIDATKGQLAENDRKINGWIDEMLGR